MDYKPKKEHRLDRGNSTCFCNRKFKDGEDPIYNMKKIGKKLKQVVKLKWEKRKRNRQSQVKLK